MKPPVSRRALLAGLAGLLAACGRRGASEAPPRVVSISPNTTETAFAIGAGPLLVGRSRFCDHPPEAARLPVVGGYADPSLEAIVALAPTLVIGGRGPAGPAIEQALAAQGIATFFPETESLDQIRAMVEALGARLGCAAGAARVRGAIDGARRAVAEAIANRPRVKAALLFDVGPIVAAGPGGFPDELLREAGGVNVITQGGMYPTVGLEHLLALDPDVLLDGAEGAHGPAAPSRLLALRAAPGWRDLRALRAGRVRALDSTALRPGPRIGDGLRAIARALHGDALLPAGAP